jgi:hypothetical protein
MALIADLCPNCRQITRCHVVERVSVVGGVLFGIPLVLPMSSVTCSCGECGFEFRSQSWDHQKTVSPADAVSLDIETILSRTNPLLKETLTLSELKATPRLTEAFQLLEQLTPGSLRTGLKHTLQHWPRLDEGQQECFLAEVRDCAEALRFARQMAGRYTTGVVGCLTGLLGCVGVWSACLMMLGSPLRLWGWVVVFAAGLMTGGLLNLLFWSKRDKRWVKEVLLPEAQRSGIRLGTLLAVLEDSVPLQRAEDELRLLRQLAPTIRNELGSSAKDGDVAIFGFGTIQHFPTVPDEK